MKVMIGTPTLDGSVGHGYALSLTGTADVLTSAGVPLDANILVGCAAMDRARDKLVDTFLKSDSTHLLQVDADISWHPRDVLKMLDHKEDWVAGVYCVKKEEPEFLVNFNGEIKQEEGRVLLGVDGSPGGFTLIAKEAIEKMVDDNPELVAMGEKGEGEVCWLHTHFVRDGRVWGEDMAFADRASKSGINLWVDPTISLTHWNGTHPYSHSLMDNLRDKNKQRKTA